MMADGSETMETKPKIDWSVFEQQSDLKYLTFDEKKEYLLGFAKAELVMKQYANDPKPKPKVLLSINSLNGEKVDKLWSTGARNVVSIVKAYDEQNILDKWIFRVKREGTEKLTKYEFIPLKMRDVV